MLEDSQTRGALLMHKKEDDPESWELKGKE